MYLSEKLKMLFIHIPHTGGVSFKSTFSDYGVYDHAFYVKTSDLKNYVREKFVFPSHVNMRGIQDNFNIDIKKYSKVTIVRNPWTRYASLWLSIKRNNQHRLTVFSNTNSFTRFLELTVNNELGFDCYNQIHFLVNKESRLELDAVIRYENYDNEIMALAEQLGADVTIQQAEGRRKNPDKTDYFALFTDYEKKLVEKYCQEEIDIFEYTFG